MHLSVVKEAAVVIAETELAEADEKPNAFMKITHFPQTIALVYRVFGRQTTGVHSSMEKRGPRQNYAMGLCWTDHGIHLHV